MKHHVLLIQESALLTGTYLATEYNKTEPDNDIPEPGLSEDFAKLTLKEIRDKLRQIGFLEVYNTIQQPDESGKIVNETTSAKLQASPTPPFLLDMLKSGGLIAMAERLAGEG